MSKSIYCKYPACRKSPNKANSGISIMIKSDTYKRSNPVFGVFQKAYRLRNEEGVALILVLWVIMFLTVIAGEFCFAMRTEVNITRNFKEDTQALYIAEAGLYMAMAELIKNELIPLRIEKKSILSDKNEVQSEEEGAEEENNWRINVDIPGISFGAGQFEVFIENESGKVNINKASEQLLRMMLDGFDLEEDEKDVIVDSILDWRDKNNLHRLNGAEDDYYNALPDPYDCKDDDFDTVDELLLVRGVTKALFFNGLREMITVYQGKRKSDSGKININAASSQMLMSLPQMTEDLVKEISEYRKTQDFRSLNDLITIVGADVYNAMAPYIGINKSGFYTIKSVGRVEGSKTRHCVKALVEINSREGKGYRMIQWLEG